MKNCIDCNLTFEITGKNHKRCKSCAHKRQKEHIRLWVNKNIIQRPGSGKGGNPQIEKNNPMFRHGICVFRRWAKERLVQLSYCCERCGNKIDASVRGNWAGHHKDHNRQNNVRDNLEVLCKRCHQIEHECWRAFQSVTTISKESTLETVEAPGPEKSGDNIV